MNLRKNRRKNKHYLNHLSSKLKVGMFVEDCRYHPCVVTERDHVNFDFRCTSLVSGRPNGCSMSHCGPVPLSKTEAYERADCMKQHGMEAYLRRYCGYNDAAIDDWREQDKVWNFDKG